MQTSYGNQAQAFAGMLTGIGSKYAISCLAKEAIPFGRGLVKFSGEEYGARLPKVNDVDFAFSAALVADDVVTVTVNGNTTAQITYATSHANTMGLIEAAVEALDGVASATVSSNTLTIVPDEGVSLSVSGTIVNGGEGTATISVTHGTTDSAIFVVAIASHTVEQASDGSVQYDEKKAFSGLRQGQVFVYVEEAVTPDDPVYLRFRNGDDADQVPGQFRKSADTARAFLCSGVRWASSAAADGFAVLEMNLP